MESLSVLMTVRRALATSTFFVLLALTCVFVGSIAGEAMTAPLRWLQAAGGVKGVLFDLASFAMLAWVLRSLGGVSFAHLARGRRRLAGVVSVVLAWFAFVVGAWFGLVVGAAPSALR